MRMLITQRAALLLGLRCGLPNARASASTMAATPERAARGHGGSKQPADRQLGRCCSDADGSVLADGELGTDFIQRRRPASYRVRMAMTQWVVVPENAVITEPNRKNPRPAAIGVEARYVPRRPGSERVRCLRPGRA